MGCQVCGEYGTRTRDACPHSSCALQALSQKQSENMQLGAKILQLERRLEDMHGEQWVSSPTEQTEQCACMLAADWTVCMHVGCRPNSACMLAVAEIRSLGLAFEWLPIIGCHSLAANRLIQGFPRVLSVATPCSSDP